MKLIQFLTITLTGGALGMVMGSVLRMAGGSCPLTCSPWRGAVFGLCMGVVMAAVIIFGGPAEAAAAADESAVLHITGKADFETQLAAASGLVLVDFYATWCGPCKRLAPIVAELAKEQQGKLTVLKVDAEAVPDVAATYGVKAYPTLVVLRNGKVLEQKAGYRRKAALEEWLKGYESPAAGQ